MENSRIHKGVTTINRLIGISLIIQMVISKPLWVSSIRELPTAPLIYGLNWGVFESLILLSLFIFLLLIIYKPLNKVFIIATVMLYFLLVLADQSRLQPWLFLYALMLLCTVFLQGEEPKCTTYRLRTIFMILSISYFWSGVQKVNYFFGIEMFPWLAEFTGQGPFLQSHPQMGYIVGIIEAAAGLALIFRPTRKVAALFLLIMHLFILISLGPFGHNWNHVVWPWNICFASILILLVWFNNAQKEPTQYFIRAKYYIFCFVLVGIMPILGIFGKWDHFLSGGFYSSMVPESIFYYHKKDRTRLPQNSKEFQFFNKGTEEEFVLLDHWALNHLGVPLYPEVRVQIQIGKELCDCVTQPENAGLRINYKHRFTGKSETIEIPCEQMKEKALFSDI